MEPKGKGRADANRRGEKRKCGMEEPSPTQGCGIAFPEGTTGGGGRWTEETLPLLHLLVSASRENPQKEKYGSLFLWMNLGSDRKEKVGTEMTLPLNQ